MINFKGDTLVTHGKGSVSLSEDKNHADKFMLFDDFEVNNRKEFYGYFISSERKCIPQDYYPCPPSVEISNDSIPKYLAILQSAEANKSIGYYDKAIEQVIKAIEIEPNKPYPYYWGSKYIIENLNSFQINQIVSLYNVNVEEWLNKAYMLENDSSYKLKINNIRIQYNKNFNKNIFANRDIYRESKEIATSYHSKGLTFLAGFEFSNGGSIELGANISYMMRNTFSKYFNWSFIIFGGSYLHFPHSDLRGYKINLLSIYAPIRIGVSPIIYNNKINNINHYKFTLRPELGCSFKNISIYYGYNLYKKTVFFDEFSKHILGMRYIFQVFPSYNNFQ